MEFNSMTCFIQKEIKKVEVERKMVKYLLIICPRASCFATKGKVSIKQHTLAPRGF